MSDKVSVLYVVQHLIVCTLYCTHLNYCKTFLSVLLSLTYNSLPLVFFCFFTLRYIIRRSTVGGETPNTIHHRAHLSLKTWHAVFMTPPSAIRSSIKSQKHARNLLRSYCFSLPTSKQAKLIRLT